MSKRVLSALAAFALKLFGKPEVAESTAARTVATHDSSRSTATTTRRNVAKSKPSRKAAAAGGGNKTRGRARSGGRSARVRAKADARAGGDRPANRAGRAAGRGSDRVREQAPRVNPVFLASAMLQRTRMSGLASSHASAGNETAAAVFDTCANLTELVENEMRHGVVGDVEVDGATK